MKKQFYFFGTTIVAMMLMLSGCSITKRHYAPGYHVEWHKSGTSHLANGQVSKDAKDEESEERMVQAPQELQPVQKGISTVEGQWEGQTMKIDQEGSHESADLSKEQTSTEQAANHASDYDDKTIEPKTEQSVGSQEDAPMSAPPTENNIFAILGLIFSILPSFWLLGVVFSIVGLVQIKKDGGEGKKLAVAGLIICGAWLLLFLLYFVIYAILIAQSIA